MIGEWLGGMPREEFLQRHFQQAPAAHPGSAASAIPYLDWGIIEEVVRDRPDTLVVRNGKLFSELVPTFREIRALFGSGCSIVLRRTERHHPKLHELAGAFGRELEGDVSIQLYITPGGYHSFGWHYDCEDVFIAQTAGVKEYFLRRNTVNPSPTLAKMPRDMQYEKETTPTMASTLVAGDSLYIPRGWWHVARGIEDSLSISVGVLSPAAAAKD